MKLSQISKQLNSKGFYLKECEHNGAYFFKSAAYVDYLIGVRWSIEELPYCCGISEIGNFTTNKPDEVDFEYSLLYPKLRELLRKLITLDKEDRKKRLYIINLVEKDKACDIMEKVLKGMPEFQRIKSFRNSNTSNLVRTYISK